jgi:hypothetical protein
MQRQKKRLSRGQAVLILLVIILAIVLLIVGISALFSKKTVAGISAYKLPCPNS